jgi:hypothetical protein
MQACDRYQAALAVKPSAHTVLYNWGVALSDLARALKSSKCVAAGFSWQLPRQPHPMRLLHPPPPPHTHTHRAASVLLPQLPTAPPPPLTLTHTLQIACNRC